MSNRHGFRIIGLMLCIGPALAQIESQNPSVNLIPNPGAEEIMPGKDFPPPQTDFVKQRVCYLNPGALVPGHWGAFAPRYGGGVGLWGATDKEAHSGSNSAYLTFTGFEKWTDNWKPPVPTVNMTLFTGAPNGYEGATAISVQPNTDYTFSFWFKGNVPAVAVKINGWNSETGAYNTVESLPISHPRKNGIGIRDHHYTRGGATILMNSLFPSSTWTYYSGSFRTGPNIRRVALGFAIENTRLLQPDQAIYVDDVTLSPASTMPDTGKKP